MEDVQSYRFMHTDSLAYRANQLNFPYKYVISTLCIWPQIFSYVSCIGKHESVEHFTKHLLHNIILPIHADFQFGYIIVITRILKNFTFKYI